MPRWLSVAKPGAVPAADPGLGAALLPAGVVRVPDIHPADSLRQAEVAHTATRALKSFRYRSFSFKG